MMGVGFSNAASKFYYVFSVPFGKRPKTLPTVLGRQEVDQLIPCTANLKHRTFLMTLYSAGLRFAVEPTY